MKSIIIFLSVILFAFTSCGNSSGNQNKQKETHTHADGTVHEGAEHKDATHTHADGTTHEGHDCGSKTQEKFKVDADTSKIKADSAKCKHECEHGHDHSHDGHKH